MKPDKLLSEFSIKVYEPPLSDLRESGKIRDLSDPIAVVMLIVDFDTEVSMGGITTFLGNSTGLYANETVSALTMIGCERQAEQLQKIIDIATAAGMTHDAIQQEQADQTQHSTTTFADLHGDKWEAAGEEIRTVEDEIDFPEIMSKAKDFVSSHLESFRKALGKR